jgi:hypothetical protein
MDHPKRHQPFWGALIFFLFSSSPAAAMQPELSRQELFEISEAVVVAIPIQATVSFSENHRSIWTHWELAVQEVLKGSAPEHLQLSLEGGKIGDQRVWVEDTPALRQGQSHVLFLRFIPPTDAPIILGGELGAVRLFSHQDLSTVIASFNDPTPLPPADSPPELPAGTIGYNLSGGSWAHQEAPVEESFVLNQASFAEVHGGLENLPAIYQAALATWGDESGAQVALRYGGLSDVLQFGGVDDDHNVGMQHSASWGTSLASARRRLSGDAIIDCDIRFYASNLYGAIDWSVVPEGAEGGHNDFQHTAIHELGHCLGLNHSSVEGSIMASSVGSGTGDEHRHLGQDDIDAILELYGPATQTPDAGPGDEAAIPDAGTHDDTDAGTNAGPEDSEDNSDPTEGSHDPNHGVSGGQEADEDSDPPLGDAAAASCGSSQSGGSTLGLYFPFVLRFMRRRSRSPG